ncbi:MAG: double-strand break repair helicase AddA [Magnetovibrio sp.]|nr:double-strand break repair helicase AddA [Magnetovibrio sp.]
MTGPAQQTAPAGIGAQVLAAAPDHSVWVSANAGTGKTRVLVDRITRLLLAGTRPERILCLTFTKAAAAEMANRLNDRLGRWAALGDDDLAAALAALLGRPAADEEMRRARVLFAETMDAPEGLRVRTIHSFCESLLGRFPIEARVAPHFQVVDERRATELRLESRDRVLRGSLLEASRQLAHAMSHLAGLVDENGFAGVMAELDAQRGRLRALLEATAGPGGLINEARRVLGLELSETRETVIAAAAADGAFDRAGLEIAVAALADGSPKDRERAGTLGAWLGMDAKGRAAVFTKDYLPLFLTQKMEPRAASGLITKKQADAAPEALSALIDEQARVGAVQETLKAVAVADNTAALLTIGVALLDAFEDLKSSRALLDYDDLIGKARALLSAGDGLSWVHYKLDGGIDHVLVDEAQDTSPDQWAVIEALTSDFFTGAGRETAAPRTIFAVGDEKQSIYSFQGADPARFGMMEEGFHEKVTAAKKDWRPVELAYSWRSTPAILNAVDAVFARPEAADGLSWRGRGMHHPTHRAGQAGRVELWPMTAPLERPEADPWNAPLDQMAADDPRGRLAAAIADTIAGWREGGEELAARGRPIEPGDVLILVRTRGAFSEEMVRALKDREIPVAGRDRLVLTEHLAVMDMIALGRFALLPDDDLNTATVLKGPFVGLTEEDLFGLAHGRAGTLWRALRDRRGDGGPLGGAFEALSHVLGAADQAPPFEFFSAILGDGGRRALIAQLGSEAADPLDEFLALALEYERDHVPSLEGFLHWIEIGETEVKRDLEQAGGEVRVMTVHGAKGLQAPVVFIADNGRLPARQLQDRIRWSAPGEHGSEHGFVLWPAFQDNEDEVSAAINDARRVETEREYRRLLYVAMTRAEDRLYVTGWQGERGAEDGCWHNLVADGLGELSGIETVDGPDGAEILRLQSAQTDPVEGQPSLPLAGGAVELPGWARRSAPAEPEPTVPVSPSRTDDDPPVVSPLIDDGTRFKRGRLIHTLLQTLPDLSPENRAQATAAYLAEPAHELTAGERTAIGGEVLAVLDHPGFENLFGPDSRAEVPIVGDIGRDAPHVISGQVDRLWVGSDAVTVVDFKTNRPPPADEADVPPVYLRQMAAYRAALMRIYPNRPVRAVLLWTDGPRLMPLSAALLDAHAP